MVRTARSVSGLPSMESGIPPSPIAPTLRSPIVRVCTGRLLPLSSDHRELPCLRDELSVRIPHHGVFVEPTACHELRMYGDAHPPGGWCPPKVRRHLDRR